MDRGAWHGTRGACALAAAVARRAETPAGVLERLGDALLDRVLLHTRHSGAIAAAQAALTSAATALLVGSNGDADAATAVTTPSASTVWITSAVMTMSANAPGSSKSAAKSLAKAA